jgi:hypothetical protein
LATPRRILRNAPHAWAAGVLLLCCSRHAVLADQPSASPAAADTAGDAPLPTLPQENFFSSVKQSLRMGDHDVVRGHFDLGAAPNSHRYYCLLDTKTRAKEPNGVLGQPTVLPDGTTTLKDVSVSLYSCDRAEKQGMLVTTGYVLKTSNGAVIAEQPRTAPVALAAPAAVPAASLPTPTPTPAPPAPPPPLVPVPIPGTAAVSPDKIDIAGIKLGMSLDEVRSVLKAKSLRQYNELTQTLGYVDPASGVMQSMAGGRFVNVIAAWTPPAVADSFEVNGESFEVMFVPVPGKERVMAIVHSVGYAPANAIHETALENGLVKKYGGFAEGNDLPDSPTWRFQSNGVQVGDPCNRRALFGGLGALNAANPARPNLALKSSTEELRFQNDHCGAAIVTEDHFIANGGALRQDRLVTRFTVTAYSPSIALEGAATAARLIEAAKGSANKSDAARAKDPAPNL